ncbi:ArsA-related P-loop ATPase [Conexibacter sp. SYSU D00693]|uniref:ArsA-related P-loop ATPase n=1 Tax=Conexibacter sp. SYSU D00693 TaxID=2812560 RepID=UPI00196AC9E9|nr:ArsA-related P-loop ATPase [Conexibacter sp. SYSU D00693]
MDLTEVLRARLVVVTGKGGVGKTTVAAALALAAHRAGARTIACEVGGQHRLPALLGHDGPPARRGRELEAAPGLATLSIDPTRALTDFFARHVPRQAAELVTRSGTISAFVAAAPGAAEVVTITKAFELGRDPRWDRRQDPYDCVVLDAPASGHGIGLLRTPKTIAGIARVGPVAAQAREVDEALRDPDRTRYVAVTIPTELAVGETLELEEHLVDAVGRGPDAIVCNGLLERRFDAEDVGAASGLERHAAHAVRAATERELVQRRQLERLLRGARAQVHALPQRFGAALGPADVELLSARLA